MQASLFNNNLNISRKKQAIADRSFHKAFSLRKMLEELLIEKLMF